MFDRLISAWAAVADWWRSWLVSRDRYRAVAADRRDARRRESRLLASVAQIDEERARLQDDVRERDQRIDALEAENTVLRSQLELFAAWEARERARVEAETAMHSARKIQALTRPNGGAEADLE